MDATEIRNLVDAYISARTERKKYKAHTDKLEVIEKEFKKKLLEISFLVQTKTLAGGLGTVERQRKIKPSAKDWSAIYAYIVKHDAFDILHKALGVKAIEDRWNDGIEIPGIDKFPVDDLTVKGEKE